MMPPRLALWACWALALWLCWRDTKKRKDISLALWLPTLWLMRCGSRGIDYWLGGEDVGRLDPTAIAILIVCGFFVLIRRPCNWGAIFANNSALFFFYGYLVISVIWVDDLDNPLVKIFRPVGDLLMAVVVATETNPREAIVTMFRRCAYLLIPMSIVLIRYFHDLGTLQDKHWGNDVWCGVTTHKNPLGQLCIVSVLAFIWQIMDAHKAGKRIYRVFTPWLYLAMTAYLLNGGSNASSRSSTAFLCLGIALALYLALGRFRSRPELVIRTIVWSVIALVFISVVLELFGTSLQAVVAASQGKDPTLTDRTYLWQDVVRIGMENPLLGTGYGGFWIPSIYNKLSTIVDNHPKEAHNGYLETFANLGLVGVGLLAWVIVQVLRNASRTIVADFEYGRLRLALLFMILVMNYSEATFTVGNHLWWYGFLIVAVYARPWVAWPEKSADNVAAQNEENKHEPEAVLA
jgi:exopolysaccharide production protein ExoQ